MLILFNILLFSVLCIYLLYPILLWIQSLFVETPAGLPLQQRTFFVTLIITARNEEKVIGKKLKNSLSINYPKEFFEILLVSDYSSDQTIKIARSFGDPRITILDLDKRHGKTGAQNVAAEHAKGEILVFSDANAIYDPEAVKHLVKHFWDEKVGCVSGELCYVVKGASTAGKKEGLYWKYEKWIKSLENMVGSILGANGSIYAVRKSNYVMLDPKDISDFIEPLEIAARGKKVVLERAAKSFEESSDNLHQEFRRKRRIVSRSLYSMNQHRWILNFIQRPLMSFELIFHKILRWISPVLIACVFVVNIFLLDSPFFLVILLCQGLFYLFGVLGIALQNQESVPVYFSIPAYVVMVGYASLLGLLDFLRNKHAVVWEPDRS